jgi:imidazolonepropionase-like amidohydrolase
VVIAVSQNEMSRIVEVTVKNVSIRLTIALLAFIAPWPSAPALITAAQSTTNSAVPVSAAQAPGLVIEEEKFRLHKFEQPIGEETYHIAPGEGGVTAKIHFEFTDRGSRVPLDATFRGHEDLSPISFDIKGGTSRISQIDDRVEVDPSKIRVRNDKTWTEQPRPASFFTIAGYSPITMQMLLLRYWSSHGQPATLPAFPAGGALRIESRGIDNIALSGRQVPLQRYTIQGLIWGRETVWMDSQQKLAAVVTVDAEFDHFEALREDCEPALHFFVSRAAQDGMAGLAEIGAKISGGHFDKLALVGANVIDATGGPVLHDATVLIESGRITAVGPRDRVAIPEVAHRMDVSGLTLLPGLWDMHAHFEQVEWGPVYLASGATTVRDVGNELEFVTSVRDAVASGRGLGPRMLLAGIVDGDGPIALGVNRVNSPQQAVEMVDRYHALRFQQIKIYSSVKLENVKAICTEAHRLGMTVTGHIPEGMNAFQGVDAGMDQINHIQYIVDIMHAPFPSSVTRLESTKAIASLDLASPEAQHAIQFLKQHGTVLDPTLSIFELFSASIDHPVSSFEPGVEKVPPEMYAQLTSVGVPGDVASVVRAAFQKDLAITGALHKAGVLIVAGTDQAVPGYSLHREIELYVEAGFTPLEAIQAATIVPARVMKMDNQLGTVEKGKLADLLLVEGDPLASIQNLRHVKYVITGGTVYLPAPLWQSVGFKP